ncbi:MAG: hypothetical protein J7621_15695 [Niastella sp.]|nr:hypothetical protein [Niastella sp.]
MAISKRFLHWMCLTFITILLTILIFQWFIHDVLLKSIIVAIIFNASCYYFLIFQQNRLNAFATHSRNLQEEKLILEINKLSYPPINSFVSIVVSIATLLLLYLNGAFDLKEKILKNETSKLELDKAQLTIEKNKISHQIDSMQKAFDSVSKAYFIARKDKERVEFVIKDLKNKKNIDSNEIALLKIERLRISDRLDSLKEEVNRRSYPYYSKTPEELNRLFRQALNEKDEQISKLNRELSLSKDSISKKISRF